MATTAEITLSSDISNYSAYTKKMTLTKAGTITDIEETTGFSRRKLAATTAVDLITMANELVEPSDNTAAKVYVRNIGDGKGTIVHESTCLSDPNGNIKWMKKYGMDNEDLPEA